MELQSKEQMTFQRREWTVQRVGSIVLALFLLSGLLGLLGAGPLVNTTHSSPDGLIEVEFDRVARANTDDRVIFTLSPEAVEDGTVTLGLTGGWVSAVDMQGIAPEPTDQTAIPNGTAMTFEVDSSQDIDVTLAFIAREHLTLDGQASVQGDTVSFSQFVLP